MSLFNAIRNGEVLTVILLVLSRAFVIFCCTPVHEFAHGYAAYKLGDDTAKYQGRLTLNPLAHLDPIGTIMIFLFGFGYAKPVQINPAKFKNPRRDMALTALAGPVSNMLMAFAAVFIAHFAGSFKHSDVIFSIGLFFYYAAMVNVMLAVFNLIPIPPLDGSRIFSVFLSDKKYFAIMRYERYIMIGFMVLLATGILNSLLGGLSSLMMKFISIIPRLIFGDVFYIMA